MLGVKLIILFVALVGCFNLASSAVSQSLPHTHPDHPGKCWDDNIETAYNPGDVINEKSYCGQTSCNDDFSFSSVSCGVKSIDDPSCKKIDHDLTLPYPDCCVEYECTDKEGKVTRF